MKTKILGLLTLGLLASPLTLKSSAAQAGIVTYDFVATPSYIGDATPVLGISSLPAGPFYGSFSVEEGGYDPNDSFAFPTLTAFAFAVGNMSWGLEDVTYAVFRIDASGMLDFSYSLIQGIDGLKWFSLNTTTVNIGWSAGEFRSSTDGCLYNTPVLGGQCIAGAPSDLRLSKREVPEPGTLALLGLGLAGLGLSRRRKAA